jgi:hypothetical protein
VSDELSEKLRTVAGKVLSGDALDSFVTYAPLDAYTTEAGDIDEEKVMGHLTALQASRMAQPRNWGQSTGSPAGDAPGETGRDALKRRWGVGADHDQPQASQIPRGQSGREALARRHGVK